MSKPIVFNNVWKKFRKGEKFNSLRDAIPEFFRKMLSKNNGTVTLEDKEFWALRDVNFEVEKGDVVGIIGPNGAGKSTILKLLSGIMVPNKGSSHIQGRLSALIEVTAGFHPELTGRENVYLNGTILGMKRKEIDEKFDEIVDFSGITEFIDTPIKRYSSGMLSRLGFSVASHIDPDVLLVDEVLAVGDIAFQSKCAQKMRELLGTGTTIMLVSHNLSLIESLCKRVILIDKGEILKEGPPEEVIPFYEDIVFHQKEEEFKKAIQKSDYKVRIQEEAPVLITGVLIESDRYQEKRNFEIGDSIAIKFKYNARERINSPVFSLEIIRADGILCCSSNTKRDNGISIDYLEGTGALCINLGKINLSPGIYLAKISIWDKDLMHPYVIRRDDFFKMVANQCDKRLEGIFLPKIEWSTNGVSDF